jgi:hypothetical protein
VSDYSGQMFYHANLTVNTSHFNWSLMNDSLTYNNTETEEGGWSNASFYIRINATDGHTSGNSGDFDKKVYLTDHLPSFDSMTFDQNHTESGLEITHNRTPFLGWYGLNEFDGDVVYVWFAMGTGESGAAVDDLATEFDTVTKGYATNNTPNFFGITLNYSNDGVDEDEGQWANETININVRANDSASGVWRGTNYTGQYFTLVNAMPNITSVEISDVNTNQYVLCNTFYNEPGDAHCQLDPIANRNVSFAIRMNVTDADGDCEDENYGALTGSGTSAFFNFCINSTGDIDCNVTGDPRYNWSVRITNVTLIRGALNDHPNYNGNGALEKQADTNNTCEFTLNANLTSASGNTPPIWILTKWFFTGICVW